VLGVLVGTAAMTVLGVWVQAVRNTDLGDGAAGITSFDADRDATAAPPLRFRDVAASLGIATRHGPPQRQRRLCEDTGSGLAWADYDGDGDFDLYVVNYCAAAQANSTASTGSRLFRNDGGRFSDVTGHAGVANVPGRGMGASWCDGDDDGLPDLFVTNVDGPNRLYHNRGDGTFRDVAGEAGVAPSVWSTGSCWGDYDRDGDVDLYVCSYIEYDTRGLPEGELLIERGRDSIGVPVALNPNAFDPLPNRLYRNLGDGRFEDVAAEAGVANPEGRSFSAAMVDLDGDGWLDIYVANDVSPNCLFRNVAGEPDLPGTKPGEVRFWDLSAVTGTADFRGSMGLSIVETGDMNGVADGLPDLFYTNWLAQENALYQSLRMPAGDIEYRDRARHVKVAEDSLEMVGWGCGFVDLDLDGRQDLVVVNGNTLEQPPDRKALIPQPMFVYWNDGTTFRNLSSQAGASTAANWCARGLAVADYDDDGLADLAISVNRGPVLLLRNETTTGHHGLRVRLRGPAAACFGAKVEVVVGTQHQFRWWGTDVGYLSGHAPELIFGLGENRQADRVQVTWADGRVTESTGVPAGTIALDWPRTPANRIVQGGECQDHGIVVQRRS
jgi:hypothetical protein